MGDTFDHECNFLIDVFPPKEEVVKSVRLIVPPRGWRLHFLRWFIVMLYERVRFGPWIITTYDEGTIRIQRKRSGPKGTAMTQSDRVIMKIAGETIDGIEVKHD